MRIQNMFHDDINRQINGVIKVDQDANDVIEQEVKEYVITKELRKHFSAFFNYYSDSFSVPTADIGVWISGFFGSGKSHFLKMLTFCFASSKMLTESLQKTKRIPLLSSIEDSAYDLDGKFRRNYLGIIGIVIIQLKPLVGINGGTH